MPKKTFKKFAQFEKYLQFCPDFLQRAGTLHNAKRLL